MIEQIKVLIAEWNWEGIAEELDTKEQREAIDELANSCRYLIGEVERIGERFLYEVNINEKLENHNSKLIVRIKELQKALEGMTDNHRPRGGGAA